MIDMIDKYLFFIFGNIEIKIINTLLGYNNNELEDIIKNFNDVHLTTNNNNNIYNFDDDDDDND